MDRIEALEKRLAALEQREAERQQREAEEAAQSRATYERLSTTLALMRRISQKRTGYSSMPSAPKILPS
jgi:ribosomal protein L9